ncbi:MAG: hypothetical protein ACLSHJ_07730 [Oscillospiraceae bacterium]
MGIEIGAQLDALWRSLFSARRSPCSMTACARSACAAAPAAP